MSSGNVTDPHLVSIITITTIMIILIIIYPSSKKLLSHCRRREGLNGRNPYCGRSYVASQTFLCMWKVQFLPKNPFFFHSLYPQSKGTFSLKVLICFWKLLGMSVWYYNMIKEGKNSIILFL